MAIQEFTADGITLSWTIAKQLKAYLKYVVN